MFDSNCGTARGSVDSLRLNSLQKLADMQVGLWLFLGTDRVQQCKD